MGSDYKRYVKMLGKAERTVTKGTAHPLIVKTRVRTWPDSEKQALIVMAFDGQGMLVTQWIETINNGGTK